MTCIAQSSTNDITLDANNVIKLASGVEAYGIIINDTIRTLKGEILTNENVGINYADTIWQASNRTNIWMHYVRKAIENLSFVNNIVSFTADIGGSGRTLTYKLVVNTDLGRVATSS